MGFESGLRLEATQSQPLEMALKIFRLIFIAVIMCVVYEGTHATQCLCGGQRTAFGCRVFLSAVGSGDQTQVIGLVQKVPLPTEQSHWPQR